MKYHGSTTLGSKDIRITKLEFVGKTHVLSSIDILFSRPKRSLAEFQSELSGCDPRKCTIIKCTIGPLEKDEGVIFKVRSRLFTETQIKVEHLYFKKELSFCHKLKFSHPNIFAT